MWWFVAWKKVEYVHLFFSTISLCIVSIHPSYSLLPLLILGDDLVLMFCKHFKWRSKKLANGIKARTLHNLITELILTLNYCSLVDGTKIKMLQLARIFGKLIEYHYKFGTLFSLPSTSIGIPKLVICECENS